MLGKNRKITVFYSYPQRLGITGVGSIAWHQVKGIAEAGHKVVLCCGSCERPLLDSVTVHETLRRASFRVPYRLLGVGQAVKLHDILTARYLRNEYSQANIVHCWPHGSTRTLRAAADLGIVSVLERPNTHTAFAFDVVRKEYEKLGLRQRRSDPHTFNRRNLEKEEVEYSLATCLACPSDFVAGTFRERGFNPSKLGRHRYGCDLNAFGSRKGTDPNSTKGLIALFAGRCDPRKGLHYALEAWHRSGAFRRGHFIICGAFPKDYRAKLQPMLQHSSIQILGFRDNMHELMQTVDLLILPSIEEGSALVTYEARAAGAVLLVSDATGAICEHGRTGLVHSVGNVDELSEHIRAVSDSPALLERLRAASLAERDEMDWSRAADVLDGLYSRLLHENNLRNG